MPTTITPNMSLVLPGVGTQAGPQYATDVNNSLSIIDTHNHTPGSGVLIPTAGLNIDNTLSFNTFGASDLQRLSLDAQASPLSGATFPTSLYASGVDLYFNDGSGNQIQITSSGQVNTATGNITGLSSPAAASYISGSQKFLWQANSTTDIPATMEGASVVVREQVAAGNGVTISAPTGLAANYTQTLPTALPSTTNALTLTNSSGAQSYLNKGAANEVVRMDSAGNNLGYSKVTQINMGSLGQQISSSSGSFVTTSSSYVDVTNLTATITTTGRPVMLMMQSAGAGSNGQIGLTRGSSSATGDVIYVRDGTEIATHRILLDAVGASAIQIQYPASSFQFVDVVAAGTYTYKVQARVNPGDLNVSSVSLVVFEL